MLNNAVPYLPTSGDFIMYQGQKYGADTVEFAASRADKRKWDKLWQRQTVVATTAAGPLQWLNVASQAPWEGNIEKPGSIPAPQLFQVFRVYSLMESAATPTSQADWNDKAYMEIYLNNTLDFGPVSVAHLVPGAGVVTASTSFGTSGVASPQLAPWMPIPFWIKGGETFKVTTHIKAALAMGADRVIEIGFEGIRYVRSVSQ